MTKLCRSGRASSDAHTELCLLAFGWRTSWRLCTLISAVCGCNTELVWCTVYSTCYRKHIAAGVSIHYWFSLKGVTVKFSLNIIFLNTLVNVLKLSPGNRWETGRSYSNSKSLSFNKCLLALLCTMFVNSLKNDLTRAIKFFLLCIKIIFLVATKQ